MRLTFGFLLLSAPFAVLCTERNEAECRAALAQAYSVFQMQPASAVRGDFNGDGRKDWAGLMERKAEPARSAIGVCLSGEHRPLLILSQHKLTGMVLTNKGSRHSDLAADATGVFERDAISVTEEAGDVSSYILRVGTFARIANTN